MLTDSGGFQMASLLKLANITQEGVKFESPVNGEKKLLLTPEDSIRIQNNLGEDVIMALDGVVPQPLLTQRDSARLRIGHSVVG